MCKLVVEETEGPLDSADPSTARVPTRRLGKALGRAEARVIKALALIGAFRHNACLIPFYQGDALVLVLSVQQQINQLGQLPSNRLVLDARDHCPLLTSTLGHRLNSAN
jgi:hypothetical protein